MRKKIIKLIVWGFGIAIFANIAVYGYVFFVKKNIQRLYYETKNNEKVYLYETYSKALNNVLYIDDLADSNILIKFYYYRSRHIDSPVDIPNIVLFPIKTKPIFVLKDFGKNSNILQVIDFDTVCWGYIKGYVFKPTVHQTPPPDSLLKKEKEFIERNKDNNPNVVRKTASPYGWYCKSWDW